MMIIVIDGDRSECEAHRVRVIRYMSFCVLDYAQIILIYLIHCFALIFINLQKQKMRPKYILLAERVASDQKTANVVVQQGSLWHLSNNEALEPDEGVLSLTSSEFDHVQIQCLAQEVTHISEKECNLLVAINANAERYRVYRERVWLREGTNLSVGDVVYVLNDDGDLQNCPERVVGKIQYIGMVSGRKGEWFGIELSVVSTANILMNHRYIFFCHADEIHDPLSLC